MNIYCNKKWVRFLIHFLMKKSFAGEAKDLKEEHLFLHKCWYVTIVTSMRKDNSKLRK